MSPKMTHKGEHEPYIVVDKNLIGLCCLFKATLSCFLLSLFIPFKPTQVLYSTPTLFLHDYTINPKLDVGRFPCPAGWFLEGTGSIMTGCSSCRHQ